MKITRFVIPVFIVIQITSLHAEEPVTAAVIVPATSTAAVVQPGGVIPPQQRFLPLGDVFQPLVADPKQAQFYMAYQSFRGGTARSTVWSVGFGETFGILRYPSVNSLNGWQFSLIPGLFAQFDWSAPSKDLINADYTFAAAASWRHNWASARTRIYHQSSHVGDEFLINNRNFNRLNLSYEAIDTVLSADWSHYRIYGGGGYLLTRDPPDLKRGSAQGGFEFTGPSQWWGFLRPVAGIDIKWVEQQHYSRAISTKWGVEIGKAGPGRRQVRVLGEYYDGFSPYGQFFNTRIHVIGAGIYLGL